MEQPFAGVDRDIVDTGVPGPHQPVGDVVLVANLPRDAVVAQRPEFFDDLYSLSAAHFA
jgi:hypothetical protein